MNISFLVPFFITLTMASSAFAQSGAASAQAFPNRPIRLVVNTSAGSSPDLIARAVGRQAESFLGQNLIVDNRAGANGIIGAVVVAHAAPDGYTVLHTSPGVILNTLVYKKLQYDIHRDFVPVTQVAAGVGYLMLVHPSLPIHTVKEFIALAKQKPLTYSAVPVGGTTHLAAELFNLRAGVQVRHIPYKSGADSVNAVMANEVNLTFSPPTGALAHVQSARLRAIAFSGSKRFARLPEVPLVSEAGVPDYVVDFTWNAWFAPAKTPGAIVNRLQAAVREALKAPKITEFLDAAAFYPVGSTPEEFREFVNAELKRYSEAVKEAKIPVQ
jgi:tripartite-type tricarboxylate transporter receptor subunit TctC